MSDKQAFPYWTESGLVTYQPDGSLLDVYEPRPGLTRRELFAAMAMGQLLTVALKWKQGEGAITDDGVNTIALCADVSCLAADALINQLERSDAE